MVVNSAALQPRRPAWRAAAAAALAPLMRWWFSVVPGLLALFLWLPPAIAQEDSPTAECDPLEEACDRPTMDDFLVDEAVEYTNIAVGDEPDQEERIAVAEFWREHVGGGFVGKVGQFHVNGHAFFDGVVDLSGEETVSNELGFRRIRVSLFRDFSDTLGIKGSIELLNGDFELKDLFLRRNLSWGDGQLGNFKEPFGLEQAASARETIFAERSLASEALTPNRSFGLGLRKSQDRYTVQAGVFLRSLEDDELEDEGDAVAARITYLDDDQAGSLRHLGLGLNYRKQGGTEQARFRSRPEVGLADERIVDTGNIDGTDDTTTIGLEAAFVEGPWSFQTELIGSRVARSGGLPEVDFWGTYAQVTWSPTGNQRRFDSYIARFAGIRPEAPIDMGGQAAWQLAARISHVDLTDEDIIGGEATNVSLGVTWVPGPWIRVVTDLIKVVDVDRPGSERDGIEPLVIQTRFQIAF